MTRRNKPRRTRLEKLQNSWVKASEAERQAFLDWMRDETMHGARAGALDAIPLATGRYLTPVAARRILDRMKRDGLDFPAVNIALGLPEKDRSLARALVNGTSLRLAVIVSLEGWLRGNQ